LKPIVGSRTPRLIELYQHAPRLTVPPGDPKGLAEKIEWLVKNYDYALAYMTEVYSYAARTQWIRMAHRHIKLYEKLISAGVGFR
jgi:glycosyltransferase involved in cell wall biosynthesis